MWKLCWICIYTYKILPQRSRPNSAVKCTAQDAPWWSEAAWRMQCILAQLQKENLQTQVIPKHLQIIWVSQKWNTYRCVLLGRYIGATFKDKYRWYYTYSNTYTCAERMKRRHSIEKYRQTFTSIPRFFYVSAPCIFFIYIYVYANTQVCTVLYIWCPSEEITQSVCESASCSMQNFVRFGWRHHQIIFKNWNTSIVDRAAFFQLFMDKCHN